MNAIFFLRSNVLCMQFEANHRFMIVVLQTYSTVDIFELPEGELSVHSHLWCGRCAVRLRAVQPQMGREASLQRWQRFTFGWTAEHTKYNTSLFFFSVCVFMHQTNL